MNIVRIVRSKGFIILPLVKSYLIELTSDSRKIRPIEVIMNSAGVRAEAIDDSLYRVYDQVGSEYMGFLESLTPRYFVIYSLHESQISDRWIKNLVLGCHELDHVWLSGLTFNVLWQRMVQYQNYQVYQKV